MRPLQNPRRPLSPEQREDEIVWRTLVAGLELDPDFDHDGAITFANRVRLRMECGRKWSAVQRRKELWAAARRGAAFVAAALALAAALAFAGWKIREYGAHDYAGYGPSKVPGHATRAVRAWYGQNDLPSNLALVSQSRGHLYGNPAWKVVFRARSGRIVCAFVWLGGSKVLQGAACR